MSEHTTLIARFLISIGESLLDERVAAHDLSERQLKHMFSVVQSIGDLVHTKDVGRRNEVWEWIYSEANQAFEFGELE